MAAGTPYVYYVGNLKNFAGNGDPAYSKPAGFLMKMTTTPGTYASETCGTYTVTTFVSDVISSDSKFTRTADQTKVLIYPSTGKSITISSSS